MNTANFLPALLLTILAGLATTIGGFFAFLPKKTNTKMLTLGLGFSAGVMLYVSFVEIFPEAKNHLLAEHGEKSAYILTVLAFFVGMLISAIIDKLVPSCENPHEVQAIENQLPEEETHHCGRHGRHRNPVSRWIYQRTGRYRHRNAECARLMRMGIFTALAIIVHNLPEGLATLTAGLENLTLGVSIGLAIMLHNIPEGIAVAVPIYYATGSRRRALKYAFFSGLAEPVGALVGYAILAPFLTESLFGLLFAAIAGIMVYISLDELLPTAEAYGEHHLCIYGLISGMILMATSLLLLN